MRLMERLKAETHELHTRAETHPFQRAMIQGGLERGAYMDYLRQMLHVHEALEGALARHGDRTPIREVVDAGQYRAGSIREDLSFFQREGDGERVPEAMRAGTARLVEEIRACDEAMQFERLLGMHYVLEGSTNGGRFITRALARAYGLEPGGAGLRYMDPYGELQQERWGEFRRRVDALGLDPHSCDQVVAGARAMFEGMCGVLESLGAAWVETDGSVALPLRRAGQSAMNGQ